MITRLCTWMCTSTVVQVHFTVLHCALISVGCLQLPKETRPSLYNLCTVLNSIGCLQAHRISWRQCCADILTVMSSRSSPRSILCPVLLCSNTSTGLHTLLTHCAVHPSQERVYITTTNPGVPPPLPGRGGVGAGAAAATLLVLCQMTHHNTLKFACRQILALRSCVLIVMLTGEALLHHACGGCGFAEIC